MSETSDAGNGPNAQQIEYWNEVSGPKWVELEPRIEAQIEPLGRRAMDAAEVAPGERVLDVGCGCGQTSLALARRVGAAGSVLGIDISGPMLARARERAGREGDLPVRFEKADAQTFDFGGHEVDLVFSRFGVMFFDDPTAAFANLAGALAPGGRVVFLCWQELKHNPWMLVPLSAAAQHVEMPAPPEPGAPGPFSFGDPDRVRAILGGAGLGDLRVEPLVTKLSLGGEASLDEATDFVLRLGPTEALLRDANDEARSKVKLAVREALAPHETPEGVRLDAAAWIVHARRV